MKLIEIFNHLTHGELSQLSLGGLAVGEISQENYPAVLSHINLGLTDLFKRFPLKEGQIKLQLVPGRLVYPLTSQYAASNNRSKEPIKYILDNTGDKFKDDVLKVESVLTESGREFPLNMEMDRYSVLTPTMTTLRVPADVVAQGISLPAQYKTQHLIVNYRANHPYIDPDTVVPESYNVELPTSHLEALLYFVASRVNNPIGMVNEFNAGNNYASKYEMACQQLEMQNLKIDLHQENTRLSRNGWV